MYNGFCELMGGILIGMWVMGIFAFLIVPHIERRQREKRAIQQKAKELVERLEKEGRL